MDKTPNHSDSENEDQIKEDQDSQKYSSSLNLNNSLPSSYNLVFDNENSLTCEYSSEIILNMNSQQEEKPDIAESEEINYVIDTSSLGTISEPIENIIRNSIVNEIIDDMEAKKKKP